MNSGRSIEGWGVLERAVDLARSGEAFVLATVVWRQGPSSGQQGSRAIYTARGEIHGWIGGACAEPVFVREAIATLEAGKPRLLVLGSAERFGDLPQASTAVEMSCQSDGALQIYLEPIMAVPHLVIVGDSPMSQTLAAQAAYLDWKVEHVAGSEFSEGLVSSNSIIIVATQGHGDEDILVAALKSSPAFVGVVASAKRGSTIKEFLVDQPIERADLDRLRVPVGLDLGHTTHKEMAVAILAELVQLRAAGAFGQTVTVDVERPRTAVDPVCGMTVDITPSSQRLKIDHETYYFCCPGCRTAFETEAKT